VLLGVCDCSRLLLLLLLLVQIVFSEAVWVGSPEDNPSEAALPLPKELAGLVQHEGGADYAYGAGKQGLCVVACGFGRALTW
jgi:hypothetical protein